MLIDSLKKNGLISNDPFFLTQYLPGIAIWIALTLPSLKLFSKTAQLSTTRRIPLLLCIGIGIGVIKNVTAWLVMFVAGTAAGRYPSSFDSLGRFFSKVSLFYYMEAIIIACVMLIIFFVLELYQKFRTKALEASQLESKLAKAQLEALRMQLQPHFLFNAHNTVSMLIRTQQYDQATEMISKISDLLRNSLKSQDHQLIPLNEEMKLIQVYLEIEQVRFEDHLSVNIDLNSITHHCMVPNLILQPIIENAFKHGISNHLGEAKLSIKSKIIENDLLLSVHNTGPSLPDNFDVKQNVGLGLNNVTARLNKLYKPGASKFDIFNDNDGVTVNIQVPTNQNHLG